MSDNQPRYTTKRLHDEIAKAKAYARREALEEAEEVANEKERDLYGRSGELAASQIASAIRALQDGGKV